MSDSPRKRGRPATVNSEAAMASIVELFRAKGFDAVSLDDLSEATGLSRPSLYRAFGDKHGMYMGALKAFGDQVIEQAIPALMQDGDLERALREFFEAMLNIYYRDGNMAPGCLVYATAPASADDPVIRESLNASIKRLDRIMRTRISQSVPQCDPDTLETATGLAANTLISFSARAKSGGTQAELAQIGARSARAIAALVT